jgi:tRNA pseudouridine38-40 synthase
MRERSVQLVLHYDGGGFAGWQRQPDERTVQGVLEGAMARLCDRPVPALGAGRTDAGVHARGQAVGLRVPEKWRAAELRRALNAVLPTDIWVAAAHEMHPEFHARYSAESRTYRYLIGTDEEASSPFRRRWEWPLARELAPDVLDRAAAALSGEHSFRAFAVRGTAPPNDEHRCTVRRAEWTARPGGLVFAIESNRFLHHMVRFLVGTMIEMASGRYDPDAMPALLSAGDNLDTAPPAPPQGLFLESVRYPRDLYLTPA